MKGTLGWGQLAILKYLSEKRKKTDEYISPTQIGNDVGGISVTGIPRHSAWASPKLKGLVSRGFVERNKRGWYRLKLQTGGVIKSEGV